MARNESKLKLEYGQENEVLAHFMTLLRFSTPTLNQFQREPRMLLIDLKELKKMIQTFGVLDKEVGMIVWQYQELEKIKQEIEVLENLVAEREIYKENLKSKIQQIEKIILLALLDLNRVLDLKNIYRKLQHLYHPDKHQDNLQHYEKISKIINQAKK